ncbi:hypothetical protein D3C73_1539920 [compost metagenome]
MRDSVSSFLTVIYRFDDEAQFMSSNLSDRFQIPHRAVSAINVISHFQRGRIEIRQGLLLRLAQECVDTRDHRRASNPGNAYRPET